MPDFFDPQIFFQILQNLGGFFAATWQKFFAVAILLIFAHFGLDKIIARGVALADDGDDGHRSEREKRAETFGRVVRATGLVLIYFVAILMILGALGIEIGPLLAGAGIFGVAIGFGSQSLVKDVIAGLFILIENQFAVGDVVKIAGTAGAVEKMTLRATTLRDLEGAVHTIPNGEISTVTNLTKRWSRAVCAVSVGYGADPDRVCEILDGVIADLRADEKFAKKILGADPTELVELGDSGVTFRALVKTRAMAQWAVGRAFLRRAKLALEAAGIEIPFPHRKLVVDDPIPVRMEK